MKRAKHEESYDVGTTGGVTIQVEGGPPARAPLAASPDPRHPVMDATVPAMAVPPDVREVAAAQVKRYCEGRVPEKMRSDARIERGVRGNAITTVEPRPPWREDFGSEWSSTKVAQLRYDGGMWTLYCADSSGRWWLYDHAAAAPRPRGCAGDGCEAGPRRARRKPPARGCGTRCQSRKGMRDPLSVPRSGRRR